MARFVALAMLLCASTASAQHVEVVRSDAMQAEVLVSRGGTYRELLEVLMPVLPAGSRAPSRDLIAERNPNRMRFVCYEAGRHARPSIRRERSFYDACEDYPRGIWFVAGQTYTVPFILPSPVEPETPAAETADDAEAARLRITADTLGERLLALGHQIRQLELSARDAEVEHEAALARERERVRRAETNARSAVWRIAIFCLVLILLLAACVLVYRRQRRVIKRAMRAIHKAIELRDKQLSKQRRELHLLREKLGVEQTQVAGHRELLESSQKEIERARGEAEDLKKSYAERKRQISELLERKAELRPLEIRAMQLRDRVELLKRLKRETPEDDIKQFTDPAYDKLIEEAQAGLDALERPYEDVIKEAGEIRAELAALLEQATGFRDDMVAVDSDLAHKREQLSDAKARAAMEEQLYKRLRVDLKKALDDADVTLKSAKSTAELLEEERASIKAERTAYEDEIKRYKQQVDGKTRELGDLKISYQKLDGKYTAQLFAGALGETEAMATLEGQLRGLRSLVTDQNDLLEETRKAIESKYHELAEVRRNLERANQDLSGKQNEILLKDSRIRELEQQLGLARHSQIATRSDPDQTRPLRRGPTGELEVRGYDEGTKR
ncbi:hypothetical protein IT407_04485 [Candidatus Uhrbacteria bacterium]|nr:hypothetical protein [Candidatus Uhrbacteria bacterium]